MLPKIIKYLAPFFSESDSFKKFKSDFGDATIDWIRPLFLKDDGTPTEEAIDMANNPSDKYNRQALEAKLVKLSRKLENGDQLLKELEELIFRKDVDASEKTSNLAINKGKNSNILQGISNSTIINGK